MGLPCLFRGSDNTNELQVMMVQKQEQAVTIDIKIEHKKSKEAVNNNAGAFTVSLPFLRMMPPLKMPNYMLLRLWKLGYPVEEIVERMCLLKPVGMRLEMQKGINNCSVINDSYVADLSSLRIALDFLQQQQQHEKHSVILSDFFENRYCRRKFVW